ncbi:MAG: HNH endonuclease [Sterolibacteriaceae bacterium MAG5]|nr:HNH endonuclease [Candidatus Nitricoxidireducens bremensis]
MSINTPREVRHTTDHDGKPIVLVQLGNKPALAKLLRDDFEAMQAAGFTDQWFVNDNGTGNAYVRCTGADIRGGIATVARLIMEPPKGFQVRYRDGDRLNLRRDNLKLQKGARPKKYPEEDTGADW